jgi:FAD/FMN-containing dehydrogenase
VKLRLFVSNCVVGSSRQTTPGTTRLERSGTDGSIVGSDEKEVVIALRFAREHDLLVAVRGGGHSCAGTAVCDDGFVIDLSLMKAIEVDAAAHSAHAQSGVLWGELDRATQGFGLAVPGGTDSEVGIAGLTLGGGNGWLQPVTISYPQMS